MLQITMQVSKIVRTNEQDTWLYRLYRLCYLYRSTNQRLGDKFNRIYSSLDMYVSITLRVDNTLWITQPLEETHVEMSAVVRRLYSIKIDIYYCSWNPWVTSFDKLYFLKSSFNSFHSSNKLNFSLFWFYAQKTNDVKDEFIHKLHFYEICPEYISYQRLYLFLHVEVWKTQHELFIEVKTRIALHESNIAVKHTA